MAWNDLISQALSMIFFVNLIKEPSIKYVRSNFVIFRHPLPKTIDVRFCFDPSPPIERTYFMDGPYG